MTNDQRSFAYALDPQLQRRRWRLDEQLAELASMLSALEPLRARRDGLAEEAVGVARELSDGFAQRLDPTRARHALDYLAELQRRHASANEELRVAEQRVVLHREALGVTQADIDKLERDRQECLADHTRELDRRAQRETDQDWIARVAWRVGTTIDRKVLS